ncbi:MAG: biotin/lipoate A/B protein ligase family protein [bacterium]
MIFWNDKQTADIGWNIAVDEALLNACETGILENSPIVRLWRQRSWAVVMGASGKVAEEVYLQKCDQLAVPVARRSSGGGTVLLGPGTFCLSMIAPLGHFKPEDRDVRTLQVKVLKDFASLFQDIAPGLEVIASGDWAIKGRKCAGSAQRRMKSHVMVHASVLNQTDLNMISRLLPPPPRQPDYRAGRNHNEFLTNLGLAEEELERRLERLSTELINCELLHKAISPLADELANERFRLWEWTSRF